MNLEEETGINIGDFATGIVFFHHLHPASQQDWADSGKEFTPERHEGPVIAIEAIPGQIEVIIEETERLRTITRNMEKTVTSRYSYDFKRIYRVECICGNQKMYHSNKEKWICPFCQ